MASMKLKGFMVKEKTIREIDEVIKINDRPYLEALSALSKDLDLATKSRTEGLSNLVDNVIVSLMGNYTMSIVVFVLAALFISRSITKPISRIISSLQNGLSRWLLPLIRFPSRASSSPQGQLSRRHLWKSPLLPWSR